MSPGLKRVLGPVDAGWLVAGAMIGSGIFWAPGLVAQHLPNAWAALGAWACGGVLALSGAAVYAELGARLPRAGGDYQFLSVAFGPAWGFLTGWAALLLTFSAAAAANAIVAVDYLTTAIPSLAGTPLGNGRIAAPGFVLLLTLANVAGARVAGRTTAWLTAIPLAGLAALFGYGLSRGGTEVAWPAAVNLPAASWPLAFGAALVPVYYTYSGWNNAAYLAAEMRRPARDLATGLLGGTAFVMLVYLAINAVLLAVLPIEQLAGSSTAVARAAHLLVGPAAERWLSLVIAVAVLGSVNVTLMAGARVYYAMAADRLAPAALERTSRAGVPSTALWVGGAWTALLATTSGVEELVNWATMAILLMSSMAVVALFVLRRRGIGTPAFRCPGYPWTPLLYLLASVAVAGSAAVYAPWQSLYGVLLLVAAFPVYGLVRRRF